MSRLYVGSEIGTLKRVILHRPTDSLDYLTPSNCDNLLFDDVLCATKTHEEHAAFNALLREQGVETLELQDLLSQTLSVPDAKQWLLAKQLSPMRLGEQLARDAKQYLSLLNNHQLAAKLLSGFSLAEIDSNALSAKLHSNAFIIAPLPNHLYTRDASSWIYGGVSLNPMAQAARERETHHFAAIYRWHPLFSVQSFSHYFANAPKNRENTQIEGGDILVLGNGAVIIGVSERTSAQGAEYLARALFATQQAREVIVVELPQKRACMHLDTVFTQMDVDTFSYYPPLISPHLPCWRLTPHKNGLTITALKSLTHAIENALGLPAITLIQTGGNEAAAEREQWNEANNVLALRPGVVVSYEHNSLTNERYDKAGIRVLTIKGEQLGRGRGGAHCMSCPIERDALMH